MTDARIRIGFHIKPQHADYATISRAVTEAEDQGADVLFNWDHFYPLSGDPDGQHFECWTMLGAWAQQTTRVEFGALVTGNGYRNPDLLADMARTVDHISDGRLILGIGSGWFERDYDEYGFEFGTPGGRLDHLAESLPRIEARWAGLNPPPTRKIPVLIGGEGEKKTLRIVAEHADIWHTFADLETFQHKSRVLADWCAKVGRSPDRIERSVAVDRTPDEVAGEYLAAGATLFTIGVDGPGYDMSLLQKWISWRDHL